jgi:site-specific recombinase XerD
MSSLTLCSILAAPIERFIALRRLSGADYRGQAQLLGYFDHFLVDTKANSPRLTREITDRYHDSLMHLAPRTRANRLCVVKQFGEYLARADALSYVPEAPRGPSSRTAHTPHIYSLSQVQALLSAAADLPPPGSLRPQTYRTLLGLLYSTGIRIGEACALTLENFHGTEQRLYIAAGKYRKARWVPLSKSACRAVQQYVDVRMHRQPRALDSPLFLNERGHSLHHVTVNQTFHRLLQRSGIPHQALTSPRLHDLRHTFAVHRLLAWYRDGQDVNARLPWLATYMGHVNIQSTQVYLHATPELIEHVDQRFHRYYLQHCTPPSKEHHHDSNFSSLAATLSRSLLADP